MTKLKQISQSKGMKPAELSESSGVPVNTVLTHWYGSRRIGPKWLKAYAVALGVSADELLPDPPALVAPAATSAPSPGAGD